MGDFKFGTKITLMFNAVVLTPSYHVAYVHVLMNLVHMSIELPAAMCWFVPGSWPWAAQGCTNASAIPNMEAIRPHLGPDFDWKLASDCRKC